MRLVGVDDLGILADDLTGACDVAACFVPVVGPVEVAVGPKAKSEEGLCPRVINTGSRLLPGDQSGAVLRAVGRRLAGKRVIFKKICAALRGAVGAELEALTEAIGPREIIVAPAIPRIGRVTRDGFQYDCGVPIDKAPYADDPVAPVKSSRISEIIRETGNVACEVRDAETSHDLRVVVDEGLRSANVVFVGSLGLAEALAERVKPLDRPTRPMPRSRRIMLVCGSLYARARGQIELAAASVDAETLAFEPLDGFSGFNLDRDVLIVRTPDEFVPERSYTPESLATAVAELLGRFRPDGLAVIGGETACHLMRKMEVETLTVQGKLDEVISFGFVENGRLAGRPFAMKGGSVGSVDAAPRMIECLRFGGEVR